MAGEMQSKLQSRGYKVFLDVDNIGSGDFPDQINQAIQQCNDFLLILSPGMLDRCSDPEDWVRHEIVLAEKYGKNIIGVSLPGFVMPTVEALPEELKSIPEKQVFLWSHEYRQASFEKIVENMQSTALKKKRTKRNYSWIGVVAIIVAVGLWCLLPAGDTDTEVPTSATAQTVIDYRQVFAQAVNDTFSSYLHTGDSLLRLVPSNPTEHQDFQTFMGAIGEYNAALEYESNYPGVVGNRSRVTRKVDSLSVVRKDRLKWELEAASKFLEVDQVDFARYRYENACILALPEDESKLQAVEKILSKK